MKKRTDIKKNSKTIATFFVDSGTAEHLANSKLIFRDLNESENNIVRCANKDSVANLKTEGIGEVI